MKNSINSKIKSLFEKKIRIELYYIILGSFLFSIAINLFIVPSNLYNGGFLGYVPSYSSYTSPICAYGF